MNKNTYLQIYLSIALTVQSEWISFVVPYYHSWVYRVMLTFLVWNIEQEQVLSKLQDYVRF